MVETTAGDATLVQEPPVKTAGEGAEAPGGKRSTADTIRDEAAKFGNQAKDKARAFAGENKDKASNALDEVARLMQGAAEDVDQRIGPEYGKYARSAADGISGFADTLRTKEVDELVENVTDFVKKSPVIAIGTAAAIGFVLARLVKSGIDAAADLGDRDEPASKFDA
ncbi:hypothetical protein [Sphingomonas sp.]|uniref:hypothetical protein n=1 Tax=Sphingomonas sp. TaxID=28214 RepID=UPI001B132BA7|nr:hypothetical protein [Sphingomonas sp.]MBO9715148.1 hypothetical protein [Sphingomonas sp.]